MKKTFTLALGLLMSVGIMAQDLPQPSPAASVSTRVGLTDVEVNYSRPAMKGRTIFGDLVPYNELWRTGANRATAITFSTPVMINDTKLDAGSYSIFTIPTEGEWTIILNKNTELWGTNGYDSEMDAVRIMATPMSHGRVESFTISMANVTSNSADVMIAWSDKAVSFPIKVNTAELAEANIEAALNSDDADWRTYRNAASYYLNNDMNMELANDYMGTSIEMNDESWYSYFLHAQIMAKMGDEDGAEDAAEMALEKGEEAAKAEGQEFPYTGMINEFMESIED